MTPALQWLYSVQQFGIKPGLDNTRRLLRELSLPGPRQKFLHVAGTNGKGSTCAFMESILRVAGERTGLFTSPHLISFCERMQCLGRRIPPDHVESGLAALRGLVSGWDPHPTFFELTMALALDWMDREGAEVIVLETGMGGRLDATNALTPVVSVITPIAMDHQQWLGDSLSRIAAEKAGIIKKGIPVVSAPQHPEAEAVIREAAARAESPLALIDEPWNGTLPLPGMHQRWNAALAAAAVRVGGFDLPDETVARGLAEAKWPGRFQVMEAGRLVIDGAHNPHGTTSTIETWRENYADTRATIIYGAVAAKDYPLSLQLLGAIAARFFFVTLQSPRAVPALDLARSAPAGVAAEVMDSLSDALSAARDFPEPILICGSLYLCGEALEAAGWGAFEPSTQ